MKPVSQNSSIISMRRRASLSAHIIRHARHSFPCSDSSVHSMTLGNQRKKHLSSRESSLTRCTQLSCLQQPLPGKGAPVMAKNGQHSDIKKPQLYSSRILSPIYFREGFVLGAITEASCFPTIVDEIVIWLWESARRPTGTATAFVQAADTTASSLLKNECSSDSSVSTRT